MIRKARELVNRAVVQLQRYQKGEDSPIKTRYGHLNESCLGGIFKGMIITIAGISGSGKTHILQQLEEDMFNKELNPMCDDYVLLRCNWEMTVFKLLLRKLKRTLNKTMKHILFNEPEEGEEQEQFKTVCDSERTDQIYYLEEPTDPKSWYDMVSAFLKEHKKKKHVVVTIDHIALVRDLFGVKKKAMDDLVEYINSLKKQYSNVSFILVSQMNRDIEGRTDVKELNPRRSDLYNSDTMFQISDLVLVIHNPYKIGKDKYMVIPGLATNDEGKIKNPRYLYLKDYMFKPENAATNFITKNCQFFHYLKMREIEDMEDIKDIFIEELVFKAPTLKDKLEKEERDRRYAEKTARKAPVDDIVDKLEDPYLEENDDDAPF